jgi:hypothetical protein
MNTLGTDGVASITTLIGEKVTMQRTKLGAIKTIPGTNRSAMEALAGKAITVVALLYSEIIEIPRIRQMEHLKLIRKRKRASECRRSGHGSYVSS